MIRVEIIGGGQPPQTPPKSPKQIRREKLLKILNKLATGLYWIAAIYIGALAINNIFFAKTKVDPAVVGFNQLVIVMYMVLVQLIQRTADEGWKLSRHILDDFNQFIEMQKDIFRHLAQDGFMEFMENDIPWHQKRKESNHKLPN